MYEHRHRRSIPRLRGILRLARGPRKGRGRGQALVEFALALPILIVLVAAVWARSALSGLRRAGGWRDGQRPGRAPLARYAYLYSVNLDPHSRSLRFVRCACPLSMSRPPRPA